MTERLPEVLLGMNMFVGGDTYMAKVTKLQLSAPKPITKEVNSPGLGGAIEVNTRKWTKAEPMFTVQGYVPKLMAMVGNPASIEEPVTFIGVMGADQEQTVEVEVSGLWKDPEYGDWETDANATSDYKIAAREYQIKIEGKEVFYIDYESNEVRVDGVNVNAELNKRLRA